MCSSQPRFSDCSSELCSRDGVASTMSPCSEVTVPARLRDQYAGMRPQLEAHAIRLTSYTGNPGSPPTRASFSLTRGYIQIYMSNTLEEDDQHSRWRPKQSSYSLPRRFAQEPLQCIIGIRRVHGGLGNLGGRIKSKITPCSSALITCLDHSIELIGGIITRAGARET